MRKDIIKSINKIISGNYNQKLLDHTKQSASDALKTTFKKLIQKTPEATGDLTIQYLVIQSLIKSQKLNNRIIQKQLQMRMIKKYLKK